MCQEKDFYADYHLDWNQLLSKINRIDVKLASKQPQLNIDKTGTLKKSPAQIHLSLDKQGTLTWTTVADVPNQDEFITNFYLNL